MKLLKQEKGALALDLKGTNKIVLNWSDGLVEVWHNRERKYYIDLNRENER